MLTIHSWLFLSICFIKLSTYIADSTDTMMPNSLGQSHIYWSYVPFCLSYLYVILTKHPSATPQVFN